MNKSKMKKFKWMLLIALLVCSIPLLARGLDAWEYATSDDIDKARIDTERILSSYDQTKDSTEIRSWLITGPSEG
jgi:hypothetical protein